MNYMKRAFVSVTRNIGKTSLLFLIVLILGSVISGAISTNQATENMENHLISGMLPIAMVNVDWEAFWEYTEDYNARATNLTTEMIRKIGALPYVESYDYFINFSLFSKFEHYEPEVEDDRFSMGGIWSPGIEHFGESFTMRGVQNPNIMEMEQNLIELVAGRVFTQDEIENISTVAVISEEFAMLNNLTVGSNMSFRNLIFTLEAEMRSMHGIDDGGLTEEDLFVDESYDIEVIGIFRPVSLPNTGDPWMDMWATREIYNRIYVPNSFGEVVLRFSGEAFRELHPERFEDGDEEFIWWENFFTLYDPNDFPSFRAAVANMLPPYFRVMDSGSSLRPVLSALETMGGLTFMVLVTAVGAAILILTLLIMLFLRDRRREVGIYLALGEKKSKILSQFLLEITVIAFLAIVVALFVGNLVAGGLSESMLMNDIAAQQEEIDERVSRGGHWDPFAYMGFQTELPADEIINSYDVSPTPFVILLFFGVGLGTVLLATVVPMIYVLRLNPKSIML